MAKGGKVLRFRFRLVGSKSRRARWHAFAMTPSGRKGPVTAMQMASRRILNKRQQWRGSSGGVAERRGGRVQHLVSVVFDEQRGDYVGQ